MGFSGSDAGGFRWEGFDSGAPSQSKPPKPKKPRRQIKSPAARVLTNIAVTLAVGFLYFYFELPALNLQSPDFYTFVLLLCDILPLVLRWVEYQINGGWIDIPVLSALILPFVLMPVGGFFAGVSLGKRQGVCPLYPVACFVCYLPMVCLLYNYTALSHCFMVAVPALAGNVMGWLYRRAVPKEGRGTV